MEITIQIPAPVAGLVGQEIQNAVRSRKEDLDLLQRFQREHGDMDEIRLAETENELDWFRDLALNARRPTEHLKLEGRPDLVAKAIRRAVGQLADDLAWEVKGRELSTDDLTCFEGGFKALIQAHRDIDDAITNEVDEFIEEAR